MTDANEALATAPKFGPRGEFFVDLRAPPPPGAIPGRADGPQEVTANPPEIRRYPIIEVDAATFLWRGEADSVSLRHFMALERGAFPFTREADSDWWRLRLQVPQRARFEYKFDIVRGGHGEWINDPLNPRTASDPFGANSVCETWGYAAPEWAAPGLARSIGEIEHFKLDSQSFGNPRDVGVYLPAGYNESYSSYPLVIVHDGFDYVDHASLKSILDNLIERRDLPPLVAALTQSPDRKVEYVDDPRHVNFVTAELLPALEQRYNVATHMRGRVLMGASLGAVASLSIAAREPQMFGGVVLKSGSFIFDQALLATRHELFRRVSEFVDGLSDYERLLHRAFVSCGRYEGLVDENRRMAAFLRHSGVTTRYVESRDAHHWGNWRDQTRAGLMWCLQPSMSRQPR